MTTLKNRSDFVRASQAMRFGTSGVHVQARDRGASDGVGIRVGFTCSKKVGNAVQRNRAKRRLRAAARTVLTQNGRDGWDYVLVGRRDVTETLDYAALVSDLRRALRKLHP